MAEATAVSPFQVSPVFRNISHDFVIKKGTAFNFVVAFFFADGSPGASLDANGAGA